MGEVITSSQDSIAGRAYPISLDIEKASSPTVDEVNTSGQDGPASRAYLISRSGLGKLMYQSLFDLHGIKKERQYFHVIDKAYKRLYDARENLQAQALIISLIGLTLEVSILQLGTTVSQAMRNSCSGRLAPPSPLRRGAHLIYPYAYTQL